MYYNKHEIKERAVHDLDISSDYRKAKFYNFREKGV